MYQKQIRIGIISILIIGTGVLFYFGIIGWGILTLIIAGLIILTLFRNEMVLLAFYFIRKGKFTRARKILDRIKYPEKLPGKQVAYYYFLYGLIESQTRLGKSEKYFRKALSMGLKMKHDQAVAKLNLAGIAISRRRKREALNLIQETKKLDKHNLLDDQIKIMQQQLRYI